MTSGANKTLTDTELIAAFLETKKQTYFNELHNRYSGKIYGKCLKLLKNQTLAEDASQEIFLKIYLGLKSFDQKARFPTWIHSVTYNHCIDTIRKNKHKKSCVLQDSDLYVAPEETPTSIPETKLYRLSEALRKIKEEDRSILKMKYWNGMKIWEMGEATNKSDSAIKMRLMRTKAKVRKIYQNLITTQKQRVVAQG